MNKLFSIHTREGDRRGHLGLEQVLHFLLLYNGSNIYVIPKGRLAVDAVTNYNITLNIVLVCLLLGGGRVNIPPIYIMGWDIGLSLLCVLHTHAALINAED